MAPRLQHRYHNCSIDVAEVSAESVKPTEQLLETHRHGEDLGVSDDDVAICDAMEVNDSDVKVADGKTMCTVPPPLVQRG